MRSIKEAYKIVQDIVSDTSFIVSGCIDIGESWVFHLDNKSGIICPPFQVFKDENIEPGFYKSDLFNDFLNQKIQGDLVPLESIV